MDKKQQDKLTSDYQKIAVSMKGSPDFQYIKKKINNKLNNFVNVIKNENDINTTQAKTKLLLAYIKSDEVIDMLKKDFIKKEDDDDFKKKVKDILIQNVIKPLCKELKKSSKLQDDKSSKLQDDKRDVKAKKKWKLGVPKLGVPKFLGGNKQKKQGQKQIEKCEKLKLEILIALVELYEEEGLQFETFKELREKIQERITSKDDFGTQQVKEAVKDKIEDTTINQSVRKMYTNISEKIGSL